MTKEEILELAEELLCGSYPNSNGIFQAPLNIEKFYRAAFAAGQTEMRERQVSLLRKNAHTFARNLVDEARALPIDGELVGSKGENE